MINAQFELERLRMTLRSRGFSEPYIEAVLTNASRDISQAISDALAASIDEAAQAGMEMDATSFVSELRAVAQDNSYYVTTDSGQLDFSEPPFPMMAHLLKNPKVAKDGSLYKVIPMGDKPMTQKEKFSSLTDIQQSINSARQVAAETGTQNGPKDINAGAMQFSGSFAARKTAQRDDQITKATRAKTGREGIKFRTVSSKQDPATQWVQPAKNKDMTPTVNDINMRLRDTIENMVTSIVQRYAEGV